MSMEMTDLDKKGNGDFSEGPVVFDAYSGKDLFLHYEENMSSSLLFIKLTKLM